MFAKLCKLINERAEEREARKAEEARRSVFHNVGTMTVIMHQKFIWEARYRRYTVKCFLQENLKGERKYLANDHDFQDEVRDFPPLKHWVQGGSMDEVLDMMQDVKEPGNWLYA